MPPTVKSLEERIDEMAEDLSEIRSKVELVAQAGSATQAQLASLTAQLGTVTSNLSTFQAQLAAVIARLDATVARLDTTIAKLDVLLNEHAAVRAKLEATEARSQESAATVASLTESHATFKGKAEATFGILRWAGGFSAVTLVTVVLAAFAFFRMAGNLESKVDHQQSTLDEIKRDLSDLRAKSK